MKEKKEIQFHVNSKLYGKQLGMVYTAFQEVHIFQPTSLQEFLNHMLDLGVIVAVDVS